VQTDANGLIHMRARYYSVETRRFLNADPIGFAGGLNWYAYVSNNPVNLVDPLGLVDMNLFPPAEAIKTIADKVSSPHYYTVAAHGTSNIILGPDGIVIPPAQLSEKIKQDPNYKGQPVALMSCNAGNTSGNRNPVAQQLANALGVAVRGADNYTWWSPTPQVTIHPAKNGNILNGPAPQTGTWKIFLPKNNKNGFRKLTEN
jgi:RHS repeat-associated protein